MRRSKSWGRGTSSISHRLTGEEIKYQNFCEHSVLAWMINYRKQIQHLTFIGQRLSSTLAFIQGPFGRNLVEEDIGIFGIVVLRYYGSEYPQCPPHGLLRTQVRLNTFEFFFLVYMNTCPLLFETYFFNQGQTFSTLVGNILPSQQSYEIEFGMAGFITFV